MQNEQQRRHEFAREATRNRAPRFHSPEFVAQDGTEYVFVNAEGTMRRRTPKIRGKAARRAERLARRLEREHLGRMSATAVVVDEALR